MSPEHGVTLSHMEIVEHQCNEEHPKRSDKDAHNKLEALQPKADVSGAGSRDYKASSEHFACDQSIHH